MSRLQNNYDYLIWFIAELIHAASDERRTLIVGECALNLPDESLYYINCELVLLRSHVQRAEVAA